MECLTFDSLKTKLYNEFTSYGLRVICCPIEGCQETYAGIQVETGTYRHELMIDKTRIPQGTALLLKDLLFFTPKGNAKDVFKKVGAELDSFIDHSATVFYFNTKEDYKKPLDLLLTLVTNLSFKEEDVEIEKNKIFAEQKSIDTNLNKKMIKALRESLYLSSPMREDPLSNIDEVKSIHYSTLKKFFNFKYTIKNMTLFVTGNVDPKELHNILASRKFIKPTYNFESTLLENKEEYGEVSRIDNNIQSEIDNDKIGYGIKFVPRQELFEKFGDDIFICYEILNDVLSGKNNIFIKKLVEDKFLLNTDFEEKLIQGGEDTFYYALFNALDAEEAKSKLDNYLSSLKKNISKKEFQAVKSNYAKEKELLFKDAGKLFLALAECYENHFAFPAVVERVDHLSYRTFKKVLKEISNYCHTFVITHKKEN